MKTTHVITVSIESIAPSSAVCARWSCHCGKRGPQITAGFEPALAKRRAARGGNLHLRCVAKQARKAAR